MKLWFENIPTESNLGFAKFAFVWVELQAYFTTLIQDLDQMMIMFFTCIPMDHDIVSDYVSSGVDVMKVHVHITLEEVCTVLDLTRRAFSQKKIFPMEC